MIDEKVLINKLAEESIPESSSKSEKVLESSSGLIPCSERLPKDGQTIIAQVAREYQLDWEMETPFCIMKYEKDFDGLLNWKHIEFDDWFTDEVVIAWQPLPEPYQPKEGL